VPGAAGLVWRLHPVVPFGLTTERSKPPMKAPQVMPLSFSFIDLIARWCLVEIWTSLNEEAERM
jgi:hypothetical protein